MRRRLGIVALAVLILSFGWVTPGAHATESCAPTSPDSGGEWRTYGHDLTNNRHQTDEHTIGALQAATLAPAWTFSVAGSGGTGSFTGTPVVADGCVFAASDGGWVYGLNADTGHVVWSDHLLPTTSSVNSTLAVADGKVFANVGNVPDKPYTVAFDETTCAELWRTTVDDQPGADLYSSPIVFNGLVFVGVSGGAAEIGDASGTADRYAFQGSFVLLDETTGALLTRTWTIHAPVTQGGPDDGYAGATVWSTAAVDQATSYAYVGTGNPFQPQKQAPTADSILKIDLDRNRPTFGQIVGVYHGNVDTYAATDALPCVVQPVAGRYPQGVGSCGQLDLDFGAAPNLFHDSSGRLLVGDGQKSGVYHAADADSMAGVWQTPLGAPSSVGGIVGSGAFDGTNVYGPMTLPGDLWSVSSGGAPRWVTPTADGVHWGEAVSTANGVVYSVDTKGFLDAYDASTGAPLLHRPVLLGSSTQGAPVNLGGGVAIARHTVYAVGGGNIVAFQPGGAGGGTLPPPPSAGGTGSSAVVAVPGSFAAGYATPATAVAQGGTLTFVNGDGASHDVVSTDVDQSGAPRFASPLIGTGQTADVAGVATLTSGSYSFYCSIHQNMRGTLVVH